MKLPAIQGDESEVGGTRRGFGNDGGALNSLPEKPMALDPAGGTGVWPGEVKPSPQGRWPLQALGKDRRPSWALQRPQYDWRAEAEDLNGWVFAIQSLI